MSWRALPTGSPPAGGSVEQLELLIVGGLKARGPLLEVGSGDRRRCPLARRVAAFGSLDQLLQRGVEVVQLHGCAQGSRAESLLIPLGPPPVPPLQDHDLALGEEVLGQEP